jgi:hypothetical protein
MENLPWHAVNSIKDIESFLEAFGGFHDSCLREIHIFTQTWVDSSLRMSCPGQLDTSARLLFQRQSAEPSAIELELTEIESMALKPTPDNADSIIYRASIKLIEGRFTLQTWCVGLPLVAAPNSTLTSVEGDPVLSITSRGLQWRDASEWMGARLRYGAAVPNVA